MVHQRGYVVDGGVNIGAYVPIDLKRALVDFAYERRTSVSDVIRMAIAAYVAHHPEQRQPTAV